MNLAVGLIDVVRVELTEAGQKILTDYMVKKGYRPTAASARHQEFLLSEIIMIFGPHMEVDEWGVPTVHLFVGNQVHLPLGVAK